MNETPTFMLKAIQGAKKDWRLEWIVYNTADTCGVTQDKVLNRPKTPSDTDMYCRKSSICVWLAKYFHPVWMAIADGKSEEDVLKLWINTERQRYQDISIMSKEEKKEINKYRRKIKHTAFVAKRSLSKEYDWNTVK